MILSILKTIGIVFLMILVIIIFILLLVLFVPIRYRFWGMYEEAPDGEAVLKWAPVFLKASASYHNKKFVYTVRLFGGVVMTNTEAKVSWIGRRFFAFGNDGGDADEMEYEADAVPEQRAGFQNEQYGTLNVSQDEKDLSEEDMIMKKPGQQTAEKAKKRVHTSLLGRIKAKRRLFQQRWREFVRRLKKIKNKKEALLKVYHSKRFEQAKCDLKQYAEEILHILKPDQLEGNIKFGLEDPANTGYVLGMAAMMLPLYQGFLTVEPDFTQQIIKGNLKGNGKIRLISVVKLGIKVILNKNLIKVTRKVQTILQE